MVVELEQLEQMLDLVVVIMVVVMEEMEKMSVQYLDHLNLFIFQDHKLVFLLEEVAEDLLLLILHLQEEMVE